MNISCLGRCRGDGKLYTLLRIKIHMDLFVHAHSFCNKVEVPCNLINLTSDQYVLVTPDFDVPQRVEIHYRGVDGLDGSLGRLSINPVLYSLASKINGQLRTEMCNAIRNIDSSGMYRELTFTCDGFIPSSDGLIVRGEIAQPDHSRLAEIVAFDSSAHIVGKSSLFLNSEAAAMGANLKYSIGIPHGLKGLCLAALDESGRFIGAVKSFKGRVYADALRASRDFLCNAADDLRYEDWLAVHRLTNAEAAVQRKYSFSNGPLFSVVVPLYRTPISFFKDMADSVVHQTYSNWELVLVNSTPEEVGLKQIVDEYASRDDRIRVIELEGNLGITENTNVGISASTGDYLCFFDHDDVLEPDILFEYARAIEGDSKIDLLYCDEDKLLPNGHYGMPTFKPDFSIDMVRDNNYICHLLTVRTGAYRQIEPSGPELDGAQDHAMVLKISELGGHIHHVAKILYHWRISETSTAGNADSKPYATEAGILAVQQHLDRMGIKAKVSNSHGRAFRYRVDYLQDDSTLASLVVPTRGDLNVLACFVDGLSHATYTAWELILVCDCSAQAAVRDFIDAGELSDKARVIAVDAPFALSAYCNAGARAASGDCLVFMHDDVVPGEDNWLDVMVGFAMREDVGVVGTMTRNLDDTIQQAGLSFVRDSIVPTSAGVCARCSGYLFYPLTVRNVFAVDGACFATRAHVFQEVGEFNEELKSSYISVDYSLSVSEAGRSVTYTPEAWMYHRSITRNALYEHERVSFDRIADKAALLRRWAERFAEGDHYFNQNFSVLPFRAAQYQLDHEERLYR